MKRSFQLIALFAVVMFTASSFSTINSRLLPTSLRVTVLDAAGNIVEGATVTLYKTQDDYFEEKEPYRESDKSDGKGRVTFKKVEARKYFIHAKKGDKDNVGEVVSTAKLKEGRMNMVNTIIK
ncbi:MAG: carboxypeptidase regulatory-like domain-containing protein [Cyclobacteriaceae bacterium]